MPIWQWADENVVFVEGYPTEFKGPHNSALVPYWRKVLDWTQDPSVRQISILKCSQAMATGTVFENLIRYAVARDPRDMLIVWGQQEMAEKLMETRIKAGLRLLSEETAHAMANCRERGMDLIFPGMVLSGTWSRSAQGIKSMSYRTVLADEVSLFDEDIVPKLRQRLETSAFGLLVVASAMDKRGGRASADDPMLLEFRQSDMCEWMMPDPGRPGGLFRMEMGFRDRKTKLESVHGLKWDKAAKREDGSWDIRRVMETAHYVTPGGAVITDADKPALLAAGDWIPQNAERAVPGHRGVHVTKFMLPWVSFGNIARDFLQALDHGKAALKVFILETLAEEVWDDRDAIEEDQLVGRMLDYQLGKPFAQSEVEIPGSEPPQPAVRYYDGKPHEVFVTVDVQKDHLYVLARQWVMGGDSGLIGWWRAFEWDEVAVVAAEHRAGYIYIDNTFPDRKQEVYEQCLARGQGWVPTIWRDQRMLSPFIVQNINPFLGKAGSRNGQQIGVVTFDAQLFRQSLLDLMGGRTRSRWYVPRGIDMTYRDQVTALEVVDGVFKFRKGRSQDHIHSCELLQVVAAAQHGYIGGSVEFAKRM